jgi:hypothetical protein
MGNHLKQALRFCERHQRDRGSNFGPQVASLVSWSKENKAFEEKRVFRAEIRYLASRPIFRMEGRLVGEWANEARALVRTNGDLKRLVVDLTDVCYIDSIGEQFLNWLGSLGAEFVAENTYARGVVERLQLSLFEKTRATVR